MDVFFPFALSLFSEKLFSPFYYSLLLTDKCILYIWLNINDNFSFRSCWKLFSVHINIERKTKQFSYLILQFFGPIVVMGVARKACFIKLKNKNNLKVTNFLGANGEEKSVNLKITFIQYRNGTFIRQKKKLSPHNERGRKPKMKKENIKNLHNFVWNREEKSRGTSKSLDFS